VTLIVGGRIRTFSVARLSSSSSSSVSPPQVRRRQRRQVRAGGDPHRNQSHQPAWIPDTSSALCRCAMLHAAQSIPIA
jgi:hypothetical protein